MTDHQAPTFKSFLLRSWLINLVFTIAFLVILVVVRKHYTDTSALRTDFLINLIALPICATHSVLLLIFALRRFAKRHVVPGIVFLVQFLVSGVITYYLYLILALFGWAYTMKGH